MDLDKLINLEIEYRDNLGFIQEGKIVGYEFIEDTDIVFFMIQLPNPESNIYYDTFNGQNISFGAQVLSSNLYLPEDIEL